MPTDYREFAKKVKEKYPQYSEVDDMTLAKKMVEKYPEYEGEVVFELSPSTQRATDAANEYKESLKKKDVSESPLGDGSSVLQSPDSLSERMGAVKDPSEYIKKEPTRKEYWASKIDNKVVEGVKTKAEAQAEIISDNQFSEATRLGVDPTVLDLSNEEIDKELGFDWSFTHPDKPEDKFDRSDYIAVAIENPLDPDTGFDAIGGEGFEERIPKFFAERTGELKNYKLDTDKLRETASTKEQLAEVARRDYILTRKVSQLESLQGDYKKALGAYYENREGKGNVAGLVTKQFAKGFTNMSKSLMHTGADLLPYLAPEAYNITAEDVKEAEEKNISVADLMAKKTQRMIYSDIEKGMEDWISMGTTDEYINSEDRNDIVKAISFMAESVGSGMSGGGSSKLAQVAFFSQSYNAMEREMSGEAFDEMTQFEKKLVSVPYGIAIGKLEKLGFTKATGQKTLLDKYALGIATKAIDALPKNASIKAIDEAIGRVARTEVAKIAGKVAGAGVQEGLTEGLQSLFESGQKNVMNAMTGKDMFDVPDITTKEGVKEIFENAATEAYYGALGGMIMAGPATSVKAVKEGYDNRKSDREFDIFYESVMNDGFRSSAIMDLQSKVRSGEITAEEALEQRDALNEAYKTMSSMPEELTTRQKRESFNLITEKNKLEKEIEGKDKSLVDNKIQRVNEINEELKLVSKQDAVQEQGAAEVPDVEATGVTEEGKKVTAEEYSNILTGIKESDPEMYWSVDNVSKEDAETGTIVGDENGYGVVSPDGDIKGVFKTPGSTEKNVADNILQKAVEAGGVKLDNFDNYLTKIYKRNGFRVVSRLPFNEEYAPEGWSKEKHGTPDVVAMVYDPNSELNIEEKTFTDYDEAMTYRDSYISDAQLSPETEVISENQITADNEIEFIQQAADKDIETIKSAGRAVKALGKTGTKVFLHKTTDEYNQAIAESVGTTKEAIDAETMKSRGEFITGKNEIHINLENADAKTVFHEAFHAVVKAKGFSPMDIKRFVDAVKKSGNLPKEVIKKLDDFSNQYEAGEINEEFLSELIGDLAASAETMNQTQLQKLADAINALFEKIGLGTPLKGRADRKEVIDFLNGVATSLRRGEAIADVKVPGMVKAANQKGVTQQNDLETMGETVESPVQEITRKKRFGSERVKIEVVYSEQDAIDRLKKEGKLSEEADISVIEGKRVATTSPDDMLVGSIMVNGEEVAVGNGGVYFVTKFGDVWASSNETIAEQIKNRINASLKENGDAGYLLLVKGSDAKLISSPQGATSSLAVVETLLDDNLISLSDFRKAINQTLKDNPKTKAKIKVSGTQSAADLKAAINSLFDDVSKSSFDNRGTLVKSLIANIGKTKSAKQNSKAIQEFFGGDVNKSLSWSKAGVSSKEASTKESIIDLVAGVSREELTKGLNGGDIYAAIEVTEEVQVVKDSHQSYPYHIKTKSGKSPKLILLENREHGSEVMTDVDGKNSKDLDKSFDGKVLGRASNGYGEGVVNTSNRTKQPSRKKQISGDGKKKGKTSTQKKIDKTTGVSKTRQKVEISEVAALKDQIRLETKSAREGAQFEKKARKAVFEFLKDRLKGFTGTIKGRRVSAVLKKALTMNLSKPEMQARFLEYVDKVINDANRVTAINNAVKLQKTLKNLAKNKDTQVSTKSLIKEYNALDPVLVKNIDEFIAQGELLHELASKSTARFKKKDGETAADVNLRQRPEMDPIKDYISKEADRAEKIRKNTLMEAYPELVEAGVIDDSMSYLDMKAKIKELETDETAITQEMREDLIKEVKEEFKAVQDNFRAIAALGINPVTGEKLTKAQLKAVQDMANISFGDIESLKDALIIRDMMLNFQENGVTDMMAAKAKRLIGKAEAKGMAETIDRTPGMKDGISNKVKQTERWYQKTFGQIDNLINDVFGSKKLTLLFKRVTGYSEIENGSSQAELLKSKAMKAYDKLFRKKKANGVNFYNATNEIERVIYARLMRNSGGTIEQISKEFQKNLELEIDSLNYLMREGRHKDAGEILPSEQREAEAVKEVFDRLGIPTDISKAGEVNMLDIEARVDKVNKQAVQFIIDKWAEHADEIGDVMQLIYNRKLSRDNNYSHTSWRRKNPMDVDIDSMSNGALQALDDGPMDNAPSGALMEANKPSRITDTRRLGYSFESSQFNALEAAMFDVYTASAVAQFNGFMESKHSRSGKIASRDDMDLMNKAVKSFYIKAKGTASGATDVDLTGTVLGKWIRGAAKYATSLVLGGPFAVIKQTVPAMMTTMWTSGANATTRSVTTYWGNKSKIDSLIDESGVDVSIRGIKSIADVYTGGDTKRDKTFFRKVLGIPNKLADFWIDKFLVWSDKGVAKTTFMAYYMQSIKRQGSEFSLDKPLKSNMEAFEYAKMMTNLYQNASNDKVMGDVFSTRNQSVSFIRQTLFPYASFLQNFKTRTYTDVKIVAKNLGYKWKDLKDSEAKQAMNGIIGSLQEVGTYAAVRAMLGYSMWYLTKKMTGWDEEEEDPEILRELNRRKDRYLAKTKKPLPDEDKMLSVKEANEIAKELGVDKVYDMPTKFSTVHDDLVSDIAWNIMYEREKKGLMTSLLQDVFSPMPATDDVVKGAINEYILLPAQKAMLDKDFDKAVEEENEIRRTTGKESMNPEQLKKFKEDYERDNYFSLYQGGGQNNQFGILSIAPRAVMDLAASYKAGANGEVIDDSGEVIGYLVGEDLEYAKMYHNINGVRTLLLGAPDIARGITSSGRKINKKSMLTPSEKTTYDIAVELAKKIGLDQVSEDEIKKIRSNEYKDVEELLAYRGEDKIDRDVMGKVKVVNIMSDLSGLNTLQVLSRLTKAEFEEFDTDVIKGKFLEDIEKTAKDRAEFEAAKAKIDATWEKAVAAAMR